MSIIDIILHEDGPTSHFVEAERSDTHATIKLPDTTDTDTGEEYRRVHIGLQELIDNAPVVAYDDLPVLGVVITKHGSIVQFERYEPEHYDFLRLYEPLRLLHTGGTEVPA